jgi:hypothetical protein
MTLNDAKEGGVTDFAKVGDIVGETRARDAAERAQRLRTANGTIIRILRRDEATQGASPKWWIKIKGQAATFVLTEKEYADAWFLREGDNVTVVFLADGDPGRPEPGQRVKAESMKCDLLDGGVA